MRIGRPVAAIVLSPAEKEKLTLIASRPKSNQRDALRARIILGAWEGLTNSEIPGAKESLCPRLASGAAVMPARRWKPLPTRRAAELRGVSTTRKSKKCSPRRWRARLGLAPPGAVALWLRRQGFPIIRSCEFGAPLDSRLTEPPMRRRYHSCETKVKVPNKQPSNQQSAWQRQLFSKTV